MSNQQLSKINRADTQRKYRDNIPMSLKELSIALELGYDSVRGWKAQGLPMFAGKVFPLDFAAWRQQRIEQAGVPRSAGRRRRSIADKSC